MVANRALAMSIGLTVLVSMGLLLPGSANAQSDTPPPTPTSGATATTFRQFGAWLDDASALPQGNGYLSIAVGEWRIFDFRQTYAPMLSGGIGVTDRLQVSASVPFRYTFGSSTAPHLDVAYASAKFNIIDPTLSVSEFGLAVSPGVEVLSADLAGGGRIRQRIHFLLPVNMELRRSPFRLYGSIGYFTRGSAFSGGAIEWRTPVRLLLVGAVTQSYSVKKDPVLDELSIGRQRVDVMGTAALHLVKRSAAYISIGRSLSGFDEGGTKLSRVAGFAVGF